ncbi:MAG: prepilin-type N-terminal cleavage/methylation domain-containing protein [Blastocatellia bacterium]
MKRAKESGFSLIELLVATALLLVILGPLLSFMKSAQLLRSTSYKLTDVEQNARAALVLIGRDLQNAGYNFTPSIDTSGSNLLTPLLGTGSQAVSNLYPIIPGNNINLVETVNSAGATVTNATDQITMVYTNQIFNNGLPLTGTINASGSQFTLIPGLSLNGQATLYEGNFCVLNAGQDSAIGIVTSTTGTNRINFQSGGKDIYNLNRPAT